MVTLTPAMPAASFSAPHFLGRVKLISSHELITALNQLPSKQKIVNWWDLPHSVRQVPSAGTYHAADCLIIGAQSPDGKGLKNLYHIAPVHISTGPANTQALINPKKTANKIADELDALSQKMVSRLMC